jgi:hypothetical protein
VTSPALPRELAFQELDALNLLGVLTFDALAADKEVEAPDTLKAHGLSVQELSLLKPGLCVLRSAAGGALLVLELESGQVSFAVGDMLRALETWTGVRAPSQVGSPAFRKASVPRKPCARAAEVSAALPASQWFVADTSSSSKSSSSSS